MEQIELGFEFFPERRVYTVSELNGEIRAALDGAFSDIRVTGEISGLKLAASGHYYFTLKERPTLLGILGILISMSGVYLLNLNRAHIAWWAPLAVLFTDRGLRYTLLAALFFAPSVVTIKWAMQCSDQYMGTLGGYLASSLLVTPIVLVTSRQRFVEIPRYWKAFVSFGLFASLTTVSQGTAYLMTLSSYVEAVKQVEILFAMVIGTVMFHEKQKVRDIAPGALVMLAGVVLLSLAA